MSPEPSPAAQRELDAIDAALEGRPVEPDLADVAELARALRADRPAPTRAFERALDRRAAEGWARRPRRRPRFGALLRPQLGLALAGVAAVAVALSALPDENDNVKSSASAPARSKAAAPEAVRESRAGTEDATRLAAPPPGQPQSTGRARGRFEERSAQMTLAMPPDKLETVAAGVAGIAERADGYVAQSTVTAAPDGGSAEFSLRVPSARLSDVLAALSKLADVRSRTQASDDITAAVTSTAERVDDLTAERRGLRRRLARTGDPAVRLRLRAVTGALAGARAEMRTARRRADLASVLVTLTGDPAAKGAAAGDDGRWGAGDALRDAGRVLEWIAGAVLIALAAAVPLALLVLPLLLLGRWYVRRGRERVLM